LEAAYVDILKKIEEREMGKDKKGKTDSSPDRFPSINFSH
jgi:hypothetical protein